jgi:hypothetical protein
MTLGAPAIALLVGRRRCLRDCVRWLLGRRHERLSYFCDDGGLIGLVVRSGAQLIARNIQDSDELFAFALESQVGPGNGDLARADAEKTAEVDDSRLYASAAVSEQIDNPADILLVAAADLDAKHAFHIPPLDGWSVSARALYESTLKDGTARARLCKCKGPLSGGRIDRQVVGEHVEIWT